MSEPIRCSQRAGRPEVTLSCVDEGGHKLLGIATAQGVALWCRRCRAQHMLSWGQLERLQAVLAAHPAGGSEGHSCDFERRRIP